MRHSLRVQLLLHFGCRQSRIVGNTELHQTGSQSAVADRVNNQREARRVCLPVRRHLFEICSSSSLETEELGVVAEVCSEVEARRAVNATELEHNSHCVVSGPDDGLQVFSSEVDASEENFFCRSSRCLRERVDVELRLYSGEAVCIIIDCKQAEAGRSAVAEEAGEVCV